MKSINKMTCLVHTTVQMLRYLIQNDIKESKEADPRVAEADHT